MIKFEKVNRFSDDDFLTLPKRTTKASAGYDFAVAEDTIVPSIFSLVQCMSVANPLSENYNQLTLKEMAKFTRELQTKPTLVPTGIKAQMNDDVYLELSVRSSCPLKHWLILANGVGVIDADYYNNPNNDGEIFFQLINLSPYDILLQKGDIVGQGIFKKYLKTDDDVAEGKRQGGFGSTSSDE